MGLDAYVYCDCLEQGRLERPLPKDVSVRMQPDGYPVVVKSGREIWDDDPEADAFACEHTHRARLHHRLGNISLIALLRSELAREGARFPILLRRVIYNGIHASDHLPVNMIPDLRGEIERLKSFRCVGNFPASRVTRLAWKLFLIPRYHYTSAAEADRFMHCFRLQMAELCDVASGIGKPIAFG